MTEIDYNKRDENIRRWRLEGVQQEEIASRLNITRQRVQQIEKRLGLGPRRDPNNPKRYDYNCATCGKPGKSKVEDRKFCSRECFYEFQRSQLTPEEREERLEARRERARQRSRRYYHETLKQDPNWREIVRDRNLTNELKNPRRGS